MGLPKIPFTPQNASINRVRIVDLPGIEVDDNVFGEQAYNLLSAPAIVRYTLAHADDLNLPRRYQIGDINRIELRRDLPRFLDNCLTSPQPSVRMTAHKIAKQLGRNLGYLLLALYRGDSVNRQARSDWTAREWDQWHKIRNIRIGGGIVSGKLGDQVIDAARVLISLNGCGGIIQVGKSYYPRMMTIIGASRYFPSSTKQALCLDIGQTSVKSAVAHFERGVLTRFTQLPTRDVGWSWRNDPQARIEIDPHEVVHFVTRELTDNWNTASAEGIKLDQDIMICIAAYVRGGQLLGNGIYARMNLLSDDVRVLLAQKMWECARIDTKIRIIHDGTAAAAVHAGEKDTAVLVLGTAIGVGFAPESEQGIRPINPDMEHHIHQ